MDKDGELVSNEFSRAPGTTSKPAATPAGLTQSHSSPNMNPLLGQGDGTWSTRLGESGWPDPGNTDSTDGKDWQPTGAAAFTDLVPEFEPGKPWKVIHFQYRTFYEKIISKYASFPSAVTTAAQSFIDRHTE